MQRYKNAFKLKIKHANKNQINDLRCYKSARFQKIESLFTLTIPHTIPHHLEPR